MARDNDNHSSDDNQRSHDFDTKPPGNKQRQEPTFSRYDENEEYEEPDRDADYTSGFHADDVDDDEDFDDDYPDSDEPDLYEDEDADSAYDSELTEDNASDTWSEKESYFEQGDDRGQSWPLGLIAVAIVALVLLVAGGYGVMQQRTATENELRELRAELATTGNPGSVSASQDALGELQLAFDALTIETETLRLESRTLSDTVAGLEAQLGSQQTIPGADNTVTKTVSKPAQPVVAQPVVAQPVATPPKPPAPTVSKPAVTASSGPWFVNFGSYAMRSVAESWAARLQPGAGKVTVIPITSSGRTLYRLRVIGLADKESAKRVAHKLETDLRVSELWVGKE
jgi:cell division protein FtsN